MAATSNLNASFVSSRDSTIFGGCATTGGLLRRGSVHGRSFPVRRLCDATLGHTRSWVPSLTSSNVVCASNSPKKPAAQTSTTTTVTTDTEEQVKVLRDIPGGYGLPVLGSVLDRLNFFWFQGREEFFRNRMKKHDSTVFRVNMPPGSPFFPDPRVVVLLDSKSFPVLFDVSKVEKRDLFTGTYRPSLEFTGGKRILSYLDVNEPLHAPLKNFSMDILKSRAKHLLPQLHSSCSHYFNQLEESIKLRGEAEVNSTLGLLVLRFLTSFLMDHDATSPDGLPPATINKWIGPQIAPVLDRVVGLPPPLEELMFHTFPLPFVGPFKSAYKDIAKYFSDHAGPLLEMAEKQYGIEREEALHNLIFLICFNTFGGLSRLLPTVLAQLRKNEEVQCDLKSEIRNAVASAGGKLTVKAVEDMPLLKSVVYEVLRCEAPVPFQYGRAREDMVIESHKEAFRVKKGEMLCGFQRFAMRDPMVFDRPDEFIANRFVGEEGEALLKYVVWSNGPETDEPSASNKQCSGKNFIVLVTRLFLAEFFLRFDEYKMDDPVQKGPNHVYILRSLSKAPVINNVM